MRKQILVWSVLLTGCMSLIWPAGQSFASEQTVKVTLPTFAVKLNGNNVDNQTREYPLLVYKDITYFPMTWYDARLLGLETTWTVQDGLSVTKGKVTSSYVPYLSGHPNAKSSKANIPDYAMTINGLAVDNSKEDYPLLSFNDVVYFPLTWQYAHDEFGWDYVWDDAEGLSITSGNPHMETVNLPVSSGESSVAIFQDHYYYVETTGSTNQVIRVPVQNTTKKEEVYSYEPDSKYGNNKDVKFEIRDGELWFSYHTGGAIMGSDNYVKVNDAGKGSLEQRGYLDFKKTSKGTLLIQQWVPPGGDNLRVVPLGKEYKDGIQAGDSKHIYGWYVTAGEGTGFSKDQSTTVIGDDVYILASSYPVTTSELNQIHKINLTTNETTKLITSGVRYFKIIHNKLYYVKDADHNLYVSNMDGPPEQKESDNKVAGWFDEVDGHIFYISLDAKGQSNLYKAIPNGEDKLILNEPVESVQVVNGKIVAKLAAGEAYGLKIIDSEGKLDLAVADQVSDVNVYNDAILIRSTKDNVIRRIVE
ncbi:DUF5050 domain-containing protein [Paenibacillus alba]|uniref:DUF5050 domain-containing protein n=1 Tax=Paenibacillus alba TaxID=1197127 RepID=A0ABU6FW47_9BACL|nr:DUF5050 domain-containing protein [Paenibacillus alba]MEC0226118.1 DUF5050 domain-containing protein [Paenibacillus alba]